MVRFAHLADCHIGAWREERMRALADEAFAAAIDRVLAARVDFVVIAGDLFNTALPGIEHIRHAVKHLGRLKEMGIPVYLIAGSHDYSPTGKTMLSVLEEAGLAVNVFCPNDDGESLRLDPVIDPATGVRLCGIPGRAGQLDKQLYERLAPVDGDVFVFHAALQDLVPRDMPLETRPLSMLPPGFRYYAGGHVHIVNGHAVHQGEAVYPGPLLPASFSELEQLGHGGFFIVDDASGRFVRERVDLPLRPVVAVDVDCSGLSPEDAEKALGERLDRDVREAVVLVRLRGELAVGAAGDIDFRSLFARCADRGAYFCMKNTAAVRSPLAVDAEPLVASTEEISRQVIAEHVGRVPVPGLSAEREERLFLELLEILARPRTDGEKKREYEERVSGEALKTLNE